MAYITKKTNRPDGRHHMPFQNAATPARKGELRAYFITFAAALAKKPTLEGLAKYLGYGPDRLTQWLHWGEVPPWVAAKLTKDYETRRRKLEKSGKRAPAAIELKALTPSLFLPD